MVSWLVTTFCMTRYSLSGDKMREVQAVNAVRKAAVQSGMSMDEAMETWKTIDQVPAEFVQEKADNSGKPENFLDRIYQKVFTKYEQIGSAPASSNAIPIPKR